MKKMKLFLMVIMSMFFTLVAQAQAVVRDAVLVGKHFTANKVTINKIDGEIKYSQNGTNTVDDIVAWMKPSGEIIFLEINGQTAISLNDKPVWGLPRPKEGTVTEVNMWLNGIDKKGESVCYGYVYIRNPPKGFLIDFQTDINYKFGIVEAPVLPPGIEPEDTYMSINGQGVYQYDSYDHGYGVYYDTTSVNQTYEIWHNGVMISSGIIDNETNSWEPSESTNMALRLKMPEGLEIMDCRNNPYYYDFVVYKGLSLDGTTTLVSGEAEKAKVFSIFRNINQMQYPLHVGLSGLLSAKITVFALDANGNLVMIGETVELTQEWGWTNFQLHSEEYQDLILVITEVETTTYEGTFEVQFGGGKG